MIFYELYCEKSAFSFVYEPVRPSLARILGLGAILSPSAVATISIRLLDLSVCTEFCRDSKNKKLIINIILDSNLTNMLQVLQKKLHFAFPISLWHLTMS